MSLKASLPRRGAAARAPSAQSAQAAPSTQAGAPPAWLADHGADLTLIHPIDLPTAAFDRLLAQTAWRAETIRLFGRVYAQPRLIAWHGDPGAAYRYSGLTLEPTPFTPLLAELRGSAAALCGTSFNSVLLNYYRNQHDSMGLHADDERELGPSPVIASLSLGAARTILFRHKTDRTLPTARILLPDASLLIMRGETQRLWQHAIEKRRAPCGPRLNLTFRRILPTSP